MLAVSKNLDLRAFSVETAMSVFRKQAWRLGGVDALLGTGWRWRERERGDKKRGDRRSTKGGGNVRLVAKGGVERSQVVLFYWRVNKTIKFFFSFRVLFFFSISHRVESDFWL